MQSIPLTDSPRQTFDVTLGGQTVGLTIWWQPLDSSWYLSMRDSAGDPIAAGRRMALDVRLVRSRNFEGDLAVVGIDPATTEEVGRMGWTETHGLYYLTANEVAEVFWIV